MTYFRNKFNKEFLYLCNKQEPKGGSVRLDDSDHLFWIFRRRDTHSQPKSVQVIPLLLFNKIRSSKDDYNLEDYMMLCDDNSDTIVTCSYDPYYVSQQADDNKVCDFGIKNITGDLSGLEE